MREINRRQETFKDFWGETCCIRIPGRKERHQSQEDRYLAWGLLQRGPGGTGPVGLFISRYVKVSLKEVSAFFGGGRRLGQNKDSVKLARTPQTQSWKRKPWKYIWQHPLHGNNSAYKYSLMSKVGSSMLPRNFIFQEVNYLSWKVMLIW